MIEKEKDPKNGVVEKVPFHKLFSFADQQDATLIAIGTVAAMANGLMQPLSSFVFGQLINAFGGSNRDNVVAEVSKVCLKFIGLAIGAGLASFLQVSCWMISGERQATRIRGLYLQNILRQDIAFFDNETTAGQVIGRMAGDTILIQEAIGEKVGKCIQLISTFVGGFAIAFSRGWLLTLVMMSSIPPIVIAGAVMSLTVAKLSSRGQKAYAEAGTVVEQTVGSIRTVVSFTSEKQAVENYTKLVRNAYESSIHEGLAAGLGIGCVLLVVFSSYGLAIWYGSQSIVHRGYTGGAVINVMIAVMTGGMSLGQTSPCVSAFAAGQAAAYKMFETINRKPTIDAGDESGIVLENMKGDIELKDIYFSYPARPDHQIFNGFSLFIPGGTTMALVGESGSGKSTVVSLVERFYDPTSGEVLIDGVNLKKLWLKCVREKVGLVSQEPILFTTTIRENIAYGKEGATNEEIQRAIALANAAKFIDNMPRGLDTMVGEHGTQLSGGQKQRIAIARAILKNPRILLLDEATSALDTESERIVQEALVNIMVDRTTVIVAHRLTTVKDSDCITVVHRGKLIEQGSHVELIKNPDGAYSQLIRLQERNDESEEVPSAKTGSSESSSSAAAKSLSKTPSQRYSFKRSISKGSSLSRSSRRSFALPFGLPGISAVPAEDPEKVNEDGEEAPKQVSVTRLAYLNKPELPVLLLGAIAAAIHGLIFPLFGLLMSSAIQTFYKPPHELLKGGRFWALMYVILGLVALAVVPMQNFLFGVAGGKLVARIRSLSFARVVHQEISWFDDPSNSSGAVGARLSADASAVKSLVGDSVALIVQNASTLTTGLLIAMIANWKLALVIIVLFPLVGIQGYAQVKFLTGFSADAKVMYEEASQVASDAVNSIRTVASFCAEQKVIDTYTKKCEGPMKHAVRTGLVSGTGFGFSNFLLFCTNALCFYAGARFVHNGTATFGQVFKVFLSLTMAALGISQTSALGPDASKAKDSAASIFAILDRKSKIDSSINQGTTLGNMKGNIEFKHVSFKYATRPDVQIFRDLCLSIPAGKSVALVGESGSGKSTVISLLERFYDPDSGSVLLDGVELNKFNINWLRQQMGLVGQEPVLFGGTIRSNIAYGKKGGEATEEEIVAASEAANAHHFISSLPHGYDTTVGERGVQLSGGQKQRIAIARAIIKNPSILLLDEATSALDAESERIVQDALEKVMVGRTAVIVAHRLSTIQGADIIAVVKNGVIAEQGRHEKLMSVPDGAYASLVALHAGSKA